MISLRVPRLVSRVPASGPSRLGRRDFQHFGPRNRSVFLYNRRVSQVTHILEAIQQGNPKAAEELLPLVYDELRKLAANKMASERPGQTLQPTALVHEAWLRLVGTGHSSSRTARIALPQQPRPCGASWWSPLEGRSA